MNGLDIMVVTVILMSGLFAFARGFVKEALSIAAWVGAAFAALYGSSLLLLTLGGLLPKSTMTEPIAAVVLFVIALIGLSMVSSAVSRRVKQSSLSAIDRTLGLVFGLARGVVLACLAYVALSWVLPPDDHRPAWIAEARTLPLLASGAERLRSLVPQSYRDKAARASGDTRLTAEQVREAAGAIRALSTPRMPPASREGTPGYGPGDQKELDRLIQESQ
jgi:membrane protein required for colicin V production